MSAAARYLIHAVEANGGRISVKGDTLVIRPRQAGKALVDQLRQHKAEIIDFLRADLEARMFPLLVQWFNQSIRLDRRWSTGLKILHCHFGGWMAEHSYKAPPTLTGFETLVLTLGCTIRDVSGTLLVVGVALKEDVEAKRKFTRSRKPAPPVRLDRKPAAPTYEFDIDESGIPIVPLDVRLISWRPKEPPVRLSRCETVTSSKRFIATTLTQLNHKLHGCDWLSGNWPLPVLIARLEACGCVVELEDRRGMQ